MVKTCNCKHEFQDKVYGKGKRVHTPGVMGKSTCTVCGAKKSN